jgi:hypothetical protein
MLSRLLAAAADDRQLPSLSYLRRKPGRGLVAVYGTADRPDQMYTVLLDELAATAAATVPVRLPQWHGSWPGVVTDPDRGLTVQAFPNDRALPALAAAMQPSSHGELWAALEIAGKAQLAPSSQARRLTTAHADPVRYKPGDRCVIRYTLRFAHPRREDAIHAETTVIGKLYRERSESDSAATLLSRLSSSSARTWCPAGLGTVHPLGLVLSEDLANRDDRKQLRSGTDVVRPGSALADSALVLAARALAQIHTSDTADRASPARTGSAESEKALKRGRAIGVHLPALAAETERISHTVSDRLKSLEPLNYRSAHGSYKPSQLLILGGAVFVVDFDQFCRADPALDVGYFLSYLRPPGMFYRRAGAREWFDAAATTFRAAYCGALRETGIARAEIDRISRDSAVYEAALLLKIAARRANRLHSPRPGELAALLGEVTNSLAATDRR